MPANPRARCFWRWITTAHSSSGRDKLLESFRRSLPPKDLARPTIDLAGKGVELVLGVDGQVRSLGQEVAGEAVPVLVARPLPGRVGVAEVDGDTGGHREVGVVGEL